MMAIPLGAARVDEALRVVRALGAHRYVAGRLHLVHAFAFSALEEHPAPTLHEAHSWARAILRDPAIDARSREEVLWRRSSDDELVALLEAYWSPGAESTRSSLRRLLERHDLRVPEGATFDESQEDGMHPILVDAGWELVPLGRLDAERHRGAIAAFADRLAFESAAFEEDTAVPPIVTLCELPALGAAELLRGARDDGLLAEPLVLWAAGNETYLDYVVRGVRRAANV